MIVMIKAPKWFITTMIERVYPYMEAVVKKYNPKI